MMPILSAPEAAIAATGGNTKRIYHPDNRVSYHVTDGFDLDQYMWRFEGPLDVSLHIDTYHPEKTDTAGYPLFSHPMHGQTARLTLMTFDVNEIEGEVDTVYLNGHVLGTLHGVGEAWNINSFDVPMEWVKLGPAGVDTAQNDVRIDIDEKDLDRWAVKVAWVDLALNPGPEPIVMVHGLNGSEDEDTDAFNDGWVNARNRHLSQVPGLESASIAAPVMTDHGGTGVDIVHLRDAVDAMRASTGSPRVNLLAHSFGGLTSRRYAFDRRNLGRVGSLVMAATPNAGSALADVICQGQRLSQTSPTPASWPAVYARHKADAGDCLDETQKIFQLQQQYVQERFNRFVRDSASATPDRSTTDYSSIGGIKGELGSSAILTGEDDGAVSLASAMWLRPENADVFGLGPNPDHPGRHEPLSVYNLRHSDLIAHDAPLQDAICATYKQYLMSGCDAQTTSIAAEPMMATLTDEPRSVVVAAPTATVAAGATGTIDLPAEGYSPAAVWMLSSGDPSELSATIDGTPMELSGALGGALGGNVPTGGSGLLEVSNNGAADVEVGVYLFAPPQREMSIELTPANADPGDTVAVTVTLSTALAGDSPNAQVLRTGDSSAAAVAIPLTHMGNGVHTGSFVAPSSGVHFVDAWITAPETLSASALLDVRGSGARLAGTMTETVDDSNGNGLWDELVLAVPVDIATAGTYRLVADVVGANGTQVESLAASADLSLGQHTITLRGSGREIHARQADGPYRLEDVALTRDDALFTTEDTAAQIQGSVSVSHSFAEFEHEPITIDRGSIEELPALDPDGDGYPNQVRATAAVKVEQAGMHSLSARLTSADGTTASRWAASLELTAGINTFSMQFPTEDIGTDDFDEQFAVRDLAVLAPDEDVFDHLPLALHTAVYSSIQSPVDLRWMKTGAEQPLATRTTNDQQVDAAWNPPGGVPPSTYQVQLSTEEDFSSVVATRDIPASQTRTTFSASDGLVPGQTYWFRVVAQSGLGGTSPPSTSMPLQVTDEPHGPAVVHAAVATAHQGESIPIAATSTCQRPHHCGARVFWRKTPVVPELTDRITTALAGGWQKTTLTETTRVAASDFDVISWVGEIPAGAVTTAGVDYYIEADDHLAATRVPGGTYLGPEGANEMDTPEFGYWHVHTLTPPALAHMPQPFTPADEPLPVTLEAVCPSGGCQATMYYQNATHAISQEDPALRNGELIATPDWPTVALTATSSTPLPDTGNLVRFQGEIPASAIDTRGVNYFFHVTDGATQAWAPGTTYEGYYAPNDGMRTGWYHVHATEPTRVLHKPQTTAGYRQPTAVSAVSTCTNGRQCTATLSYRTATGDVLDTTTPFEAVPMAIEMIPGVGNQRLIRATGVLPAEVADTRGVDYFVSFTDGATAAYWPGTSHVDGYAPVPGTRVAYHHLRVLEPPHVSHVPVVRAQALQDLPIEAAVTCATETCQVRVQYQSGLDLLGNPTREIAMTQVSPPVDTPLGKLATYRGVIPAVDVTTAQLAYAIEAFDGYTYDFAPGTFHASTYIRRDGERIAHFPVRVTEPPHLVHVPPGNAQAGSEVPMSASSNCSTPVCSAVLHWRVTGTSEWNAVEMTASRTAGAGGNDLVEYRSVVPGADVTAAGLEHWIEVTDGYWSERTPTWPTPVN